MTSTPTSSSSPFKVKATRVLAVLATICIASYFTSLAYALSGLDRAWTMFFMSHVLWFLYLPFTLGLVYFYMRVQLGRWLLKDGAFHEAFEWSSARLTYHFWLRGKREALIHRIVTARVHLLREEYEEARAILWLEEPLPERAPELLELDFLRALWGMRSENIKIARECAAQERTLKRPKASLAMRLAILAECEVRARHFEQARALLEESRWIERTRYADFVEVLCMASSNEKHHGAEHLWLSEREQITSALEALVPGALPEFFIACGQLLDRRGDLEEGRRCVERAGELLDERKDQRSLWCWRQLLGASKASRASTWAREMAQGEEAFKREVSEDDA